MACYALLVNSWIDRNFREMLDISWLLLLHLIGLQGPGRDQKTICPTRARTCPEHIQKRLYETIKLSERGSDHRIENVTP